MKRYVLQPPVPVRALVIAAVLVVAGALLVVLSNALSWPGLLMVLGVLLLVLGAVLIGFAFIAPIRLKVAVTTDESGYRITGGNQQAAGQWAEISRAVQSDSGGRITLEHRDGRETHILVPGNANRTVMDDIATDIGARLNRH
ncbi:hypothetical protein [Enemella sp. A6]|uniref:hypothetical protein n=1 Tax=Enemella sp. A6 TaxID=3440152 RepID=UPI003EB9771F